MCLTVLHASALFDYSGEKKKLRITEMMGASLPVRGQVSEQSLTSIKFIVIPTLHIFKWIFNPLFK